MRNRKTGGGVTDYPNPFNETTIIPYYVPKNSGGHIKVFNINGELIGVYLVAEGYNQLELSTENWLQGVYMYIIEIDGEVKESKRMILIK